MKPKYGNVVGALVFAGGLTLLAQPASATIITYDVNLTFDPNATPELSLGAAGPGTVTGTLTIDTSLPIKVENTAISGPVPGNLVSVDLVEKSNNGTILSVFSNSATQGFTTVTPYNVMFIGSPVTEYPASSELFDLYNQPGEWCEKVSFSSQPIFDLIQMGPSITFDFPYTAGGSVIPGNFDSIASTGFNAYLYGTVTPVAAPEPATWAMMLLGFASLGFAAYRKRSGRGDALAQA